MPLTTSHLEQTQQLRTALRTMIARKDDYIRRHIAEVYEENKFLHGEVPDGLNQGINMGIRIICLQIEGILNVPNLPHHICIELIRNLVDISLTELNEKDDPSIFDLDRYKMWEEVKVLLS